MNTFIQELNLRNSTTTQVTARIWQNSRPRKVGTLIWITLNQGLPVGTWLQHMGILPHCKVCDCSVEESPKHCLLECQGALEAWEAFKKVWDKWEAHVGLDINWPFVLLGELVLENEDDPPGLLAYHAGGFTYPRQPLDILKSFILYHIWIESCKRHFGDQHSVKSILTQAWVATVEVGMATWKAIRSHKDTKDPSTQINIKLNFR
jgi:hypothetical protein